jgi:peptidoglycan/LPS O-acetylase OafA/YrhL
VHSSALDELLGLNAQVVFIAHLFILMAVLDSWPIAHCLRWSARAALIVFFCLSGFVITSSIQRARRRLPRFAMRRIACIYPPYLFAIAACWSAYAGARVPAAPPSRCLVSWQGPLLSLTWALEVMCYMVAGLVAYAVTIGATQLERRHRASRQ